MWFKRQRPFLIFISYRRDDTSGYAGRVYDALSLKRRFRKRVFLDVDSIRPGQTFAEAIQEAADSCEVAMVLIDEHWLGRIDGKGRRRLDDPQDFVRLEVQTALNRDIKVIPVLIEGASMPFAEQLPPPLQKLAAHQPLRLFHEGWAHRIEILREEVDRALRERKASRERSGRLRREWSRIRGALWGKLLSPLIKILLVSVTLIAPNVLIIWLVARYVALHYWRNLEVLVTVPGISIQLAVLQASSASAYFFVWMLFIYPRLRRRLFPAKVRPQPEAGASGDGG